MKQEDGQSLISALAGPTCDRCDLFPAGRSNSGPGLNSCRGRSRDSVRVECQPLGSFAESGKHQADGKDYVGLFVNFATCQISDSDSYGRAIRNSNVRSI